MYEQLGVCQWTYHLGVSGTSVYRSYPPSGQNPVVVPWMYQSQTVGTEHDLPGQTIATLSRTIESVDVESFEDK